MMRLHELGWGAKRLSKEFGSARNAVRRHLRAGGSVGFEKPERRTAFGGSDKWLRERIFRHRGKEDAVCPELASEHGIVVGLRPVVLGCEAIRQTYSVNSYRGAPNEEQS